MSLVEIGFSTPEASYPKFDYPCIPFDFPDPSILKDGNVLLAAGTQCPDNSCNLQGIISYDYGRTWTNHRRLLSEETGLERWAGEFFPEKINGKYVIVYVEHDSRNNASYLRSARSTSIFDQFKPDPGYILSGKGIHTLDGSISFDSVTGKYYLVEGSGWEKGDGIRIWELDPENIAVKGAPKTIADNIPEDQEMSLIEGAYLEIRDSISILYFCGPNYMTTYKERVLVAEHPLGPYQMPPGRESNILLSGSGQFIAPGQVYLFDPRADMATWHLVDSQSCTDEKGNFLRLATIGKLTRDRYGIPLPMDALGNLI